MIHRLPIVDLNKLGIVLPVINLLLRMLATNLVTKFGTLYDNPKISILIPQVDIVNQTWLQPQK
jgi:hypothetical protein